MEKNNGIFILLFGVIIGATVFGSSSAKALLRDGFQSVLIAAGFGIAVFVLWKIIAAIVKETKLSIQTSEHWLSELIAFIGACFIGLSCIWALFNRASDESFSNAMGRAPTASIAVLLLGVGLATLVVEVIVSRVFKEK